MRKKIIGLVTAAALVATGLVLAIDLPATAQRVSNTGAITLTFGAGTLQVGDSVFEASSSETPITATGTIGGNGAITGIAVNIPPLPPITGLPVVGTVNPVINVINPQPTANINPLTGLATFAMTVEIRIPELSSNCEIGPITLSASSANAGGVPYNTTTGSVTMADHTFSVPAAQGCTYLGFSVNTNINDEIGLPSPSGDNHGTLTAVSSPILVPAVRPSFTATPDNGFLPLNVSFDASATQTDAAGLDIYDWDFDGNGTFEGLALGPTPSHIYLTPGVFNARLRVTDPQGDSAITSRPITVVTPLPDLALDKSDDGSIVSGQQGTYTLSVSNVGDVPSTPGTTVVTDTLPAGLVFDSYTGAGGGWVCGAVGQDVTCTNPAGLVNGFSYDDIVLTVTADGSFIGAISNTATVSTLVDPNAANNSDTEPGQIIQAGIDLTVDKTHDAEDGLFRGERATYRIAVANVGTQPTVGRIRIVDPLPAGVTLVNASGPGWTCTFPAGEVRCFNDETLDPGESLADLTIRVDVDVDAPASLSNTVTATVDGDANEDNNVDTDVGDVLGFAADLAIAKSHFGDLVVGEPTTYTITVENVGTDDAGNTVTVVDELPAGLDFVSAAGPDWTCGAVGQTVTCTSDEEVEAGDSLASISLQVIPNADALPSVTNTATVSSADDFNAVNNEASDPGDARLPQPDLSITKTHEGNFETASNGTYTITVRNLAFERADGPTTVTDILPAGLTFVSASGGPDWSCGAAGQTVTCTYADAIEGTSIAPAITVVAFAPDGAPDVVANIANVDNAGDTDTSNNTVTDPTRIDRRGPAPTVLTADAIVLRLEYLGKISILAAPKATLTSNGVGVPGKTVTFTTFNGTALCSAVTNAGGVATCNPPVLTYLLMVLQLRYNASYAGDLDYQPDVDQGALIHIITGTTQYRVL